jgi:hypothetical protein
LCLYISNLIGEVLNIYAIPVKSGTRAGGEVGLANKIFGEHPLDSCDESFQSLIDTVNVFHLADDEFEALVEAAPSPEIRAWLRGILEAKQYFNALKPEVTM